MIQAGATYMLIELGHLFLVFAMSCSLFALFASYWGAKTSVATFVTAGQRAVMAVVFFLSLAIFALEYALLTDNFAVEYVASYSSRALPFFYKFTSLWAGQAGSLLFWGWLLSLFSLFVILNYRNKLPRVLPYTTSILMLITSFFIFLVVFIADPFALLPHPPVDGRGLNPLLQHPAMVIHPPMLYLGYVGFAVPFAFGMAALLSGAFDREWVSVVRRWTIVPWFFLGIGMLLGGKWAYMELGWGGYWAWDPVENAAFMPWLTGTAFLHSIIIQEKKNMLKTWNMVLIILTFLLCIFGTFLTRSGIISSVHSFTTSAIGPMFSGFLLFATVASFGVLYRYRHLLKSTSRIESVVSRESTFLINNVVFVGACFAVLWGTIFPVISEAVRGVKITVGPPFFNAVNIPIFLFLLFLTGVGPLVAWRKSSVQLLRKQFLKPLAIATIGVVVLWLIGIEHFYALLSFGLSIFVTATIVAEFHRGARARMHSNSEGYGIALMRLLQRNKRRYGGYVVHFAIVLFFIGTTGAAFDREEEVTLKENESFQIGGYELIYHGFHSSQNEHRQVFKTHVDVHRDGRKLATLHPERHFYFAQEQPTTEVDVYSTMMEDVYVVFAGWDQETKAASFHVYIKPLVIWVWISGMVLSLGTLIILLPDRREGSGKKRAVKAAKPRRRAVASH